MGWLTARNRHKLLFLKFWNRLCSIPESRITRKIFDWDRQYASVKGSWSNAARQLFIELEHPELFDDVSPYAPDTAQKVLEKNDLNDWDINRYKSQKLRYYNLYKYDKSSEDYLHLDLTKYQRSVFAQFRFGILPLEIEVGRYRDTPLHERTCQVCGLAVEDEIHFLLTCDKYSEPRQKLLNKAIQIDNTFPSLDVFDQFVFLVSNLQKSVIKYLTNAIAIRTKLLNRILES